MSRFGIISAFPGELKPLVNGWKALALEGGQAAWRGRIGSAECVAIPGGMGKDRAARACALAQVVLGGLDSLVSLGWAGALSCGVYPAQAYAVAEVIDVESGKSFPATFPPGLTSPIKLLSLNHVARAEEKRRLAEKYGAVLVDMEAASVGMIANYNSLKFCCLKSVSDVYNEILPDFGGYAGADGRLRLPALLAHTAVRPKYWRPMARLGKNAKTGALAVAEALRDLLERHADDLSG